MKPIYKSLALAATTLQVSLALNAQTYDGTTTSETALPAEVLESLRVELVALNVSGARDLIKSGECTIDGSDLAISLNAENWIKGATYRVQVIATFGTQTQVIYALDVTVPYYDALSSTPQEYEDDVTVVSTIGDGDKSGADASVYSKDGDGNAHITKPLSVSGGVQEGSPFGAKIYELNVVVLTPEQKAEVEAATGTAYDYCDTNDEIPDGINVTIYADEECTQKVGSTAKTEYAETPMGGDFFNLQDGESIEAGTYYSRVKRGGFGNYSHAEGVGTTASGDASHAEGDGTTASGDASHAEGDGTTASGGYSHAEGGGTIASGDASHAEGSGTTASGDASHAEGGNTTASGGYSHAEGFGTIASQASQHVCGKYNVEDENGDYAMIIGNGADNQSRSNAFAIDWNGNLVLFNAGTPVVLTPAKLATLIA